MNPFFSPADALRISIRTAMMLQEAQIVIGMRMLGMAGLWAVPASENRRMVTEKISAMRDSGISASRAAISGQGAGKVADAALSPIAKRTRSNVTRLTRTPKSKPRTAK